MSTPLVFIDGDQGTTGLQIHERLRGHVEQQDLKLLMLSADVRKDAQRRVEAINACDTAILYLLDAATREAVVATVNPRVCVTNTSSAYRTTSDWVHGLPEMSDEQAQRVVGASHVINPGRYSTGAIGLLCPFAQAGLVPTGYPISIHVMSGHSGGDCAAVETYEGPEAVNALPFQVYKLGLVYKHTPEIQLYAGFTQRPMSVPAYSAHRQGIVLTVPLELHRLSANVDATALHACLADHCAGASHVDVVPLQAPPALPHLDPQAFSGTNDVRLSVFANDHGQVLLTAVFDNLSKGASGVAVQNLDLMLVQQQQIEWKASQHLVGRLWATLPSSTLPAYEPPVAVCARGRINPLPECNMSKAIHHASRGGHLSQTGLLTDRAIFTEAYVVIPKGVARDIVTSWLPFWTQTRLWVIARPLSGFAEAFSQYIAEVNPSGGGDKPE